MLCGDVTENIIYRKVNVNKKHMTKYTLEFNNRIHLLPSTGESEPSLLKLKFPKKPGGENCGD